MGKFLAAGIIVAAFVKLAPMCARLPSDLTMVSGAVPAAAPAAVAAAEAPAVSTKAAAVPEPPKKPEAYPADKAAVTVNTYRMRRMFKVADGKAMVSVSVKNVSERDAKGLTLAMSALVAGKRAERWSTNSFDLAASTSIYRGLRLDTGTLDQLLAEPAAEGTELRWDLKYKLDGEETPRCYVLRALPRTAKDAEGIEWKTLSQSSTCEK